jgi:hypothetical protein
MRNGPKEHDIGDDWFKCSKRTTKYIEDRIPPLAITENYAPELLPIHDEG